MRRIASAIANRDDFFKETKLHARKILSYKSSGRPKATKTNVA